MKATETAKKIIEKFGTTDVYQIAEKANVKIVYESWFPSTVGEFDKKTKTICINRRALEIGKFSERKIIAHELGHFFAMEFNFDRKTEESFAETFAVELLNQAEILKLFGERNL